MESVEEQFKKIYDEYSDAIFRHLYYRLSDRERALDLTQEVFTRYWAYTQKGKVVKHPKAFLYRSAHNCFVNEIRTDKKMVSLDAFSENARPDVVYEEADVEEVELQAEVVEKIQRLRPQYRDTLVMRFVDGLEVKKIAEILGESPNTISVRIKRGLEDLREIYDGSNK